MAGPEFKLSGEIYSALSSLDKEVSAAPVIGPVVSGDTTTERNGAMTLEDDVAKFECR